MQFQKNKDSIKIISIFLIFLYLFLFQINTYSQAPDKYLSKIEQYLNLYESIKSSCFDNNLKIIFTVTGNKDSLFGDKLMFFKDTLNVLKLIYQKDVSRLKPWKIICGDIDCDGNIEVLLGVYKTARFHKVMAKRCFVFGWDGIRIFPKWLGSRLSQPMIDFDIVKSDSDSCLILRSLERQRNRLNRIMTYKWKGFGFEGLKEVKSNLSIKTLDEYKP